ncbi:D-alanyl-D-alanine dipeptidase [Labrenzia sp. EL_13]|nr:D-alanyl-D-alanine dipeptidase [Labrenzia sp. EL_13]
MWTRQTVSAAVISLLLGSFCQAGELPDGFVYLREYVPDIRQEIRYAGKRNFMRQRLPGYNAGECVLTEAAAKALGKVQNAAVKIGRSLVVFDCYRPQGAVEAMVAWVKSGKGTDPAYFPNVSRSELIRQGYIGAKSSHARGSTVDVGFDLLGEKPYREGQAVCKRNDRETVDFGTPFDCFDPASRTASAAVSAHAQQFRRELVSLMRKGGFRNYPGEWWHFTLSSEPFPNRSFTFAIDRR